jgi:hypothetical protein
MNKSLLRPAAPSDSFGSVPRLGLSPLFPHCALNHRHVRVVAYSSLC